MLLTWRCSWCKQQRVGILGTRFVLFKGGYKRRKCTECIAKQLFSDPATVAEIAATVEANNGLLKRLRAAEATELAAAPEAAGNPLATCPPQQP